jgi:YfiH family protein
MKLCFYDNLPLRSGVLNFSESYSENEFIVQISQTLELDKVFSLKQVSTDTIIEISIDDLKRKSDYDLGEADAVIINLSEPILKPFAVGIKAADCLPILVYSEKQVALIHAGWRGLGMGLIEKTLNQLKANLSDEADIKVLIGAAAKSCCYQVGKDVLEFVGVESQQEKENIDLQELAHARIKSVCPHAQFSFDLRCTICSRDLHSYRDNKTTLRNFTFVIFE